MADYYENRAVYNTLCSMLNRISWKYTADDNKMLVKTTATGEDIPIELNIQVLSDKDCVMLYSRLPITVPEDKRIDAALGITAINMYTVDGCFEFKQQTGEIFYRMTELYHGIKMTEQMLEYMLFVSCKTVDDYNDKLLMLIKGIMSIEEFIKEARA